MKVKKTDTFSNPNFFNLSKRGAQKEFEKIIKNKKPRVVDTFENQLKELFVIRNPSLISSNDFEKKYRIFLDKRRKAKELSKDNQWVYFPWRNSITHILDEKEFFEVRTARNQNLITKDEQKKFYNSTIGVAGLSVGSSVATTLVLQGGAKHLKLADFDDLELSNTNRIKTSIDCLGMKKVDIIAQQIYEINPYAKVEIFYDGLTENNIDKFFQGLDVVVDEVDSLPIKLKMRQAARKNSIPLFMGIDNGEGVIVDIERYDQEKNIKPFDGRLGNVTIAQLKNLTMQEIGQCIVKIVEEGNIDQKMLESIQEIGKEIVSWPQLGSTASLNGSVLCFCIQKTILAGRLPHKRVVIGLKDYIS